MVLFCEILDNEKEAVMKKLLGFVALVLCVPALVMAQDDETVIKKDAIKKKLIKVKTRSIDPSRDRVSFVGIQFEIDSWVIRASSRPQLDEIGHALEELGQTQPEARYLLEGHTCDLGDDAHNMNLSRKRAEAVKNYLTNQFRITEDALGVIGYGKERPRDGFPNVNPENRKLNRRVEIALTK